MQEHGYVLFAAWHRTVRDIILIREGKPAARAWMALPPLEKQRRLPTGSVSWEEFRATVLEGVARARNIVRRGSFPRLHLVN